MKPEDGSQRRHYKEYRWGDPAPTRGQFGYASQLGVLTIDGMTREEMSQAIGAALEAKELALVEFSTDGI